MHSCHDSSLFFDLSTYIGFDSSLIFIVSIILTGVFGSFTHCIGMCGPIAMMQSSMRLMHIKSDAMNQSHKIHASLAIPYYLGKATTYVFYYLLIEILTISFKTFDAYNYIIALLMLISGLAFAWLAISKNFNFFSLVLISKKKSSFLEKIIKRLNLKPFGLSGYFMGVVLGLIPCGFVYAVVLAIASYVDNIALGAATTFAFGISTIPGLFVISYFGNYVMERFRNIFSIFLRSLAALNSLLLFKFAYSLIILH